MAPPILHPPRRQTIPIEPLTPPTFSPFGTAIAFPLSPTIHSLPTASPRLTSNHPTLQPSYEIANQTTALKFSNISPLINNYHTAPSSHSNNNGSSSRINSSNSNSDRSNSKPQMSMFSCFPRQSFLEKNNKSIFEIKILERHPFTTQTFCPLNFSGDETVYLVIVAPTLSGRSLPARSVESGEPMQIQNPPDLDKIQAFVARSGQAVTYAPGTWHAPMVVLGRRRVDFVVTQFVSGVPDEDCQEVTVGDGVGVDVTSLVKRMTGERAKL